MYLLVLCFGKWDNTIIRFIGVIMSMLCVCVERFFVEIVVFVVDWCEFFGIEFLFKEF